MPKPSPTPATLVDEEFATIAQAAPHSPRPPLSPQAPLPPPAGPPPWTPTQEAPKPAGGAGESQTEERVSEFWASERDEVLEKQVYKDSFMLSVEILPSEWY